MFEECETLAELSKARKEYLQQGISQLEVNAAYNKAKTALMERTQSFRKIPIYTGKCQVPPVIAPLPILSVSGKANELIITSQGVVL